MDSLSIIPDSPINSPASPRRSSGNTLLSQMGQRSVAQEEPLDEFIHRTIAAIAAYQEQSRAQNKHSPNRSSPLSGHVRQSQGQKSYIQKLLNALKERKASAEEYLQAFEGSFIYFNKQQKENALDNVLAFARSGDLPESIRVQSFEFIFDSTKKRGKKQERALALASELLEQEDTPLGLRIKSAYWLCKYGTEQQCCCALDFCQEALLSKNNELEGTQAFIAFSAIAKYADDPVCSKIVPACLELTKSDLLSFDDHFTVAAHMDEYAEELAEKLLGYWNILSRYKDTLEARQLLAVVRPILVNGEKWQQASAVAACESFFKDRALNLESKECFSLAKLCYHYGVGDQKSLGFLCLVKDENCLIEKRVRSAVILLGEDDLTASKQKEVLEACVLIVESSMQLLRNGEVGVLNSALFAGSQVLEYSADTQLKRRVLAIAKKFIENSVFSEPVFMAKDDRKIPFSLVIPLPIRAYAAELILDYSDCVAERTAALEFCVSVFRDKFEVAKVWGYAKAARCILDNSEDQHQRNQALVFIEREFKYTKNRPPTVHAELVVLGWIYGIDGAEDCIKHFLEYKNKDKELERSTRSIYAKTLINRASDNQAHPLVQLAMRVAFQAEDFSKEDLLKTSSAYGVHYLVLNKLKEPVALSPRAAALFKAPEYQWTEELKEVSYEDFEAFYQSFLDEVKKNPLAAQNVLGNLVSEERIKKACSSNFIKNLFNNKHIDGVSVKHALSFQIRVIVLYINKLSAVSIDQKELSARSRETFLLTNNLLTCIGGNEQAIRSSFQRAKQGYLGSLQEQLKFIDIDKFPEKHVEECLDAVRVKVVLGKVHDLISSKDPRFIQRVTKATDLRGIDPAHQAIYIRNLIGTEIGERTTAEGVTFDYNGGYVDRALRVLSRQEILNAFEEAFPYEEVLPLLSVELIHAIEEQLASLYAEQAKAVGEEAQKSTQKQITSYIAGLGYWIGGTDWQEDNGLIKGVYDEDLCFWSKVSGITDKAAERIMRNLGWWPTLDSV